MKRLFGIFFFICLLFSLQAYTAGIEYPAGTGVVYDQGGTTPTVLLTPGGCISVTGISGSTGTLTSTCAPSASPSFTGTVTLPDSSTWTSASGLSALKLGGYTMTFPASAATILYSGGAGLATNLTGTASGLTAGTANAAPVSGLTGAGTGVLTALANAVNGAGGFITGLLTGHQVASTRYCASTTGSSSSIAYTCSTTPSFTPVAGDEIIWDPTTNDLPNSIMAPTLAVNGAASAVIKKNAAVVALNPWDVGLVKPTSQYMLTFDGTYWELQSHTANSISTYNNAPNDALSQFYACLNNADLTVCRILLNADSELTCWLGSTCNYGPANQSNLPTVALLSLLQKRGYPLYSTGVIGPISVVSTSSLLSNGILPGITCTGTVVQASIPGIGPQQATGQLLGGGTLQMSSGAVCTVAVSTFVAIPGGVAGAFNRFKVYCDINTTTGNMTITISGQAASTACTGTNASPLLQTFTVTNTAGTTALSVAITCTTGTCNLGAYEEIYTTNNYGIAIDSFEATGGANSYWLGAAAGNSAYLKAATGITGLIIHAIGINDAAGSIAASATTANMATLTAQFPSASVLVWSSFPYTGTGSAGYAAIQSAEQAWALANLYDFLNTADNASTSTSVNYWEGIQNSDTTHPTNMGASANFAQLWIHLFGSESQSAMTFGSYLTSGNNGYLAFINSTDTSAMEMAGICYVNGLTYCGRNRTVVAPNTTFSTMWADGVLGTQQTMANGAVANIGAYTLGYSQTAGDQVPAIAKTAIAADPVTGLVYMPLNRVALTTAYTVSSATPTAISSWTWPILSGQTLIIECDGMYLAASTGGLRFEATGPTMTAFQLVLAMGLNSTAASMATPPAVTALSTLTNAVAVTTAATNYYFHLYIYANASAAGTLAILGASAASVATTVGVGSACSIK